MDWQNLGQICRFHTPPGLCRLCWGRRARRAHHTGQIDELARSQAGRAAGALGRDRLRWHRQVLGAAAGHGDPVEFDAVRLGAHPVGERGRAPGRRHRRRDGRAGGVLAWRLGRHESAALLLASGWHEAT